MQTKFKKEIGFEKSLQDIGNEKKKCFHSVSCLDVWIDLTSNRWATQKFSL